MGPRVRQAAAGAGRIWAMPLDVPGVVSFRASFPTGAPLDEGGRMAQRVAVRALDRGSRRLDRFGLSDWLEARGAQLHFFSDDRRAGFAGRALAADVPDVLALAAETLATPLFPSDEVEKVRREMASALEQAATDTGFLAQSALTRALYPPDHPAFTPPLDAQQAALAAVTPEALRDFHARHLANRPLVLALAGDVGGLDLSGVLDAFPDAPACEEAEAPPARVHAAGREHLPVADKANVDVRMGHGLALRRHDPDYAALRVAVFALGGNFSSRLMQTVRDRDGLTYGIRAALGEIGRHQDGHVDVSATFSPHQLARGLDATRGVIEAWHRDGLTGDEAERVAETIAGSFLVGLSTTHGMAATLVRFAEEGFGPDYLDRFPRDILAVRADAANDALRRYVHPDALALVTSGPEG